MSKVLKADASAADAYVEQDIGTGNTDIWVTCRVFFNAPALAAWIANGEYDFVHIYDTPKTTGVNGVYADAQWHSYFDAGGTPTADAWHLVELHSDSSGPKDLYIDSVLIGSTPGSTVNPNFVEFGQVTIAIADPDAVVYIDNVKIGTTRGGTELFADDFEDGTLDAWTSTSGNVSVVDDPAGGIQGFCIAFSDDALEPNPTWTRLDDPDLGLRLRVSQVSIDRGMDAQTGSVKTGTAAVTLKDPDGDLDPTNTGSPFYGTLDPCLQAAYARYNPVDETWSTRFRGYIKAFRHNMDTSGFAEVTIELVDAFDLFATLRLTPGDQGDTPRTESVGEIFYAGGSPVPANNTFKHVDQRLAQALDDAGWPGTGNTIDVENLRDIFSGNVSVQEQLYDRDGQMMEVLADAADAEFPDVSRLYVSREGVVSFRGRFARFFPDRPGYGITTWEIGGAAQAAADPAVVKLQSFSFRRSSEDIFNVATALPKGLDDVDVPGNMVTDPTSISRFWRRPWMSDSLLTWEGHDDVGDPVLAAPETKKFAQFKVDNFKDPKTRIEQVVVTWQHPDSFSGEANWAFLQAVELSDLLSFVTTHRGGGGFDEDYYVESIREVDEQGPSATVRKVTMYLDVSPRSFYESNPFGEVDEGVS